MTIQTYHFEGHELRHTLRDGEPWFIGTDVCRILAVGNTSRAMSVLADDERQEIDLSMLNLGGSGKAGNPVAIAINELGLYRLIFKSREDVAERFKRWVFRDVLPALRRPAGDTAGLETGGYAVPVAEHIALLNWKIAMLEKGLSAKGKRPPKVTAEELERMKAWKVAGISLREIAIRSGRSLHWTTFLLSERPSEGGEGKDG